MTAVVQDLKMVETMTGLIQNMTSSSSAAVGVNMTKLELHRLLYCYSNNKMKNIIYYLISPSSHPVTTMFSDTGIIQLIHFLLTPGNSSVCRPKSPQP